MRARRSCNDFHETSYEQSGIGDHSSTIVFRRVFTAAKSACLMCVSSKKMLISPSCDAGVNLALCTCRPSNDVLIS